MPASGAVAMVAFARTMGLWVRSGARRLLQYKSVAPAALQNGGGLGKKRRATVGAG